MNDPNGLVELGGVHHLFFQHNPLATSFGRIHWGHATSSDLLSWTEHAIALTPGDDGDYDQDGCWSGCALVLPDGRVALLYSANRHQRQLPALATAADVELLGWAKSPANPVIAQWPPVAGLTDLRDHTVLREVDGWRQVVGAGRDQVVAGARAADPVDGGRGGLLLSYVSEGDDVTSWRFDGVLLDGHLADLPGEVWECPDIFLVAGGTAVVILSWYVRVSASEDSVVNDVLWLTGPLTAGRFTPTRYGRLDLGDRCYAPQSYDAADGRRLMLGWLRTQLDPASAGLPSVGTATLPRQLSVLDGQLRQEPARELDALVRTPAGVLRAESPVLDLSCAASALELVVEATQNEQLAAVVLELSTPGGHTTTIALSAFDAVTTWQRRDNAWVPTASRCTRARLLVDAGLIEIFTDDGRAAAHSDLTLVSVQRVALSQAPGTCVVSVAVLSTPAAAKGGP